MTIAPGTRLGPYEILSPLGAGGMGEVYKARDTRVERMVALKVLPEGFLEDEERRSRFEREARILASLNHPGIAHLYSFEESPGPSGPSSMRLLVMELADGQTLLDRLLKGPFPVDQLLKTAIEIASALDAATSRLTATASSDYAPIWSRDGKKILYGSAREGLADIYEIGAGGGSGERLILHDAQDKNPLSWAPDGRSALLSVVTRATRDDIWILPLSEPAKAVPLVATRFAEVDGQISPEGRWFAYSSDESGRFEVYVQPFADGSNRYRVSTSGGARPRWRADGKELFFLAGSVLQSVAISAGDRIEAGPPRDLLRLPVWGDYAVTRDGRILAATSTEEKPFQPMTVVLNWTAGLGKP